jgi:hypothetical protein
MCGKTKAPVTPSPVVTGALFALSFSISLESQRSPMNNRAHKIEKAKKRSKEYFAQKAFQSVHYAAMVVHSETSNLPELCPVL